MARKIISLEELNQFEIDGDGRLYWQGERVLTDVRLSLPKWAQIAVVAAGIGTFGLFGLAALQAAGLVPAAVPQIHVTVNYGEPPAIHVE